MATKTINFKVFRYKQGQDAPRYDTFPVEADENTTVLVALQAIRRDQDPTLTLRHSCHHASCGTCGMLVNGREELACVVRVLELETETVVVEPLRNLPVVSDLVVDMDPFYAVLNGAERPYIRHSEFLAQANTPDGIETYSRYENCIECGACVSACPITGSDEAYIGPAALAAAWRVVDEPRGQDPQKALEWVDHEHGCWRCHVAFECTEACPSNVEPAEKIMALRRELTKQKLGRFFRLGRS
ncbi:MAG: succinate dehydrogenase/fumarate reductase iron-sulfur subunit [Candidatus Promineifilaceae bacterium]|nr:succinate dehydrogenase/fumarate reductase iron-sulfur subunit [Candidatus Promineifilaceae bacterium]